jgi:hypothetical protein
MTPRHWFALALRILGVMQLIDALTMLVQAYDIHASVFTPQVATVIGSLHYVYAHMLIGWVLLVGAPFLSGLLVRPEPAP